MKRITKLCFFIIGFQYLLFLIITKGFYRGFQIFYRKAQEDKNYLGHISKQFITFRPLNQMFLNWEIFSSEYENPRVSKIIISQYSSSSLNGYGSKNFNKGGSTLLKQQRALIIPFITDFCNNAQKNIRMCEIGCGNGDVIFYLSKMFKHIKFFGVDFIIKNAREKYPSNVKWLGGYALDMIKEIRADAIYSSSTWVLFTPRELESYLSQLKKYRCRDIFISEPVWGTNYIYNETKVESFHLEAAVWLHNWPAYFKKI